MARSSALALFTLLLAAAGGAQAATCGTFAAPTSCSITVGGQITYTATSFIVSASTGTRTYQGSDFNIDISAVSGNEVKLSFSKNAGGATPGVVFFANPGETANFTLQYNLQISAAAPGTVSFASPTPDAVLATSSAVGNGFSQVQLILSNGVQSASCSALRNSVGVTAGDCALPPSLGTTMLVGDLGSLNGGSSGSNTSIGTFENHFLATFTAAVPEPGTWALFGLGALVLGWRVHRRG